MLNFEGIKNEKTIVGGLDGEYKVKLTGFDTKTDSKGNTNYQFVFSLVEFEGITKNFNTSIKSMYNSAVSNIAAQLGFNLHEQVSNVEVLTKASKEPFSLWVSEGYVNFYDRKAYEEAKLEKAIDATIL